MANQAVTLEPTSSPYQTLRTVVLSGLSSILTTKNSSRRLLFLSGVLVISAVLFVAIVSLAVYFSKRWSTQRGSVDAEGNSFCCPEDAEDVARFVNATINPCRNFFAHVCTDVIKHGLWRHLERREELAKIMVTGFLPKELQKVDATGFIIAYYQSCLKAIPNRDIFLYSIATKLATNHRDLLRRPNTTSALIYAATASVKYRLPSILDIIYYPLIPRIFMKAEDRCRNDTFSWHLASFCLKALKDKFDAKIPLEELSGMHAKICKKFGTLSYTETQYSAARESDAFDRDVWDLKDLRAALVAIGFSAGKELEIHIAGGSKIRAMHDLFSTAEYSGTDVVKGAYLLWLSVASIAEQFYTSYDGSWPQVFQICNDSVEAINEIWDLFTAEILTTPQKDEQAIVTFSAVKDAVFWDCRRSWLFEAEDAARLESHFKELALLTPTASTTMPVALPKPTPDFAENLLRGRAFNFEAFRARLWGLHAAQVFDTGIIPVVGGRYFLLPAFFYDVIRPTSPSSQLANMAALGWLVAESMWSVVLYGIPWNSKTEANLQKLRACFVRTYLGSDRNPTWTNVTMAASLGLSSLLSAFRRPDWNVTRMAFSALEMSHGHLFYSLATYLRCPTAEYQEFVSYVNVPLMYVNDFANVFHCSQESTMAKPELCSIRAKLT
ncbi:hypothetical protein V5799_010937 [Amblyomma americanum]|uniref:Uncharacterized protein n=1 Tax=Amblyomma americanum TaxID=6943 RepID=A0AAQ4EIE6_AMBAM